MKKILLIVIGVLLVLAGAVWTLQGLNLMGQSGGMNGEKIWAIIGPIVAIIGLVLLVAGVRSRRSTPVA